MFLLFANGCEDDGSGEIFKPAGDRLSARNIFNRGLVWKYDFKSCCQARGFRLGVKLSRLFVTDVSLLMGSLFQDLVPEQIQNVTHSVSTIVE